jgi:hypothetical protein
VYPGLINGNADEGRHLGVGVRLLPNEEVISVDNAMSTAAKAARCNLYHKYSQGSKGNRCKDVRGSPCKAADPQYAGSRDRPHPIPAIHWQAKHNVVTAVHNTGTTPVRFNDSSLSHVYSLTLRHLNWRTILPTTAASLHESFFVNPTLMTRHRGALSSHVLAIQAVL